MPESRRTIFLAGLLLVLAGLAAYSNSFHGPFIFDDSTSITKNSTIQQGWVEALSPPMDGQTVMGRPMLNLSFAFNYWLGGLDPWGYHVLNLVIHLLAGLTLFGLVRRTLRRPALQIKFGESSGPLAFTIALLWTVHPLQTESVSYIVQRAESLVSLFYLLTLYFFVRGVESRHAGRWLGLSLLACLLGIFSKEVMVTAPLLTLLYDRTFVAGTFREAWRRRWKYYLALAGTWIPLFWVAITTSLQVETSMMQGRQLAGASGFSPGMLWWGYLLKQCEAIVHYLWLAIWPHPLVLDYGMSLVTNPLDVAPQALLLLLLVAGTLWALVCRSALGFLGAWFFLILAPSSSIVPLMTHTMAEHRLYLPLAAVLVLAVLGLYARAGWRSLAGWAVVAAGFAALTYGRNLDYRGAEFIWADTVQKKPDSVRAYYNLGGALMAEDRLLEAAEKFLRDLQLDPHYTSAEAGLGNILVKLGRPDAAVAQYRRVAQARPGDWVDQYNLAVALAAAGERTEAITRFRAVLQRQPDYAEAHFGLANALFMTERAREAATEYETGLRLDPQNAAAHNNLGFTRGQLGDFPAALGQLREALRLDPDFGEAHFNLGTIYLRLGRLPEAAAEFKQALRRRPAYPDALNNLGLCLLLSNQAQAAMPFFAEAARLQPDFALAHFNLGRAFVQLGRNHDALLEFTAALHYNPNLGDARKALEQLPSQTGQ